MLTRWGAKRFALRETERQDARVSSFSPSWAHALLAVALLGGCQRGQSAGATPPTTTGPAATKPHSDLGPSVHRLLDALTARDAEAVRAWMTPQLRQRVSIEALVAAAGRLGDRFGKPRGIIEEHSHREGTLSWYSGLVLYENDEQPALLTPVLIQFALSSEGDLDRLLIREHWFIDSVEHPAETYLPITRFHLPSDERWFVLHGGRTRATNKHHGSRAQRYAYDLIVKKRGRQRRPGSDRHDNASFYAHGMPLRAPAAGIVVHAVDGVAENRPPETGSGGGNGLIIHHGFGEYSALWHAIPGTVTVRKGDRVESGQLVGKVGNSGRSTGPHIHYHVSYRPEGWEEAFGLPADFVDLYVDGVWKARHMPVRGQQIKRADEAKEPPSVARSPEVILAF